ncbi:hypothetical protein [Planctomicrobium sp. SH664]|uniref:hypothetical protein n=1 Tax=Planctomicrobium sp. SH664 TaxID=3448125 RepID=UPI003F5C62DF
MHILGKVLLGLCILLVLVAVVFSAQLLDIRHRWLKEVETRQTRVRQNAEQLEALRRKVQNLEADRQRLVHEWGDVWVANNSGPQPGSDGIVEIGVGTASGIRVPADLEKSARPVAFVFGSEPSGQTRFLGEFQLVDIAAGRSAAQLIRAPYPGEMDAWPRGQYHIRQTLPGNWLSTIGDLEAQTVIAQARLDIQKNQLSVVQKQNQESQAALDQRMVELNGDPAAIPGTIPEIVDGLVETVRKHEASRNKQLSEIDVLRKKLDDLYVRMRNVLAENLKIVEQMQASAGSNSRSENASLNGALLPTAR